MAGDNVALAVSDESCTVSWAWITCSTVSVATYTVGADTTEFPSECDGVGMG